MFNPFQDYFSYTKSKITGIIGLLFIALIAFSAPYLYSHFNSQNSRVNSSEAHQENQSENTTFDPNVADRATLLKYGLSAEAIDNILSFRARGGRFYTAESLQSIYGVSEKDYKRLVPSIRIELTEK